MDLFTIGAMIFIFGFVPSIVGFGPIGILAGSCAAACQSCQGDVESGSCFACCTSAGMRKIFVFCMIIGMALMYFGYESEKQNLLLNYIK